jgi:signal transduction histidine kinase
MRSGSVDREALAEIAQAVERERRRIARGLHDRVGRQLTEAARELDRFDPNPRTERVKTLIEDALDSTRSLTFDLGLPPIGEHGLGGLLETVCRTADARHEINVFFEEHGEAVELADGVVVVLSQIVRELLFNVVKHALASTAAVSLRYEAHKLRITVTDDGVGLTGELNAGGFGLADSRRRLRDLGGHFEFGSKDGLGTRVVLELPVD